VEYNKGKYAYIHTNGPAAMSARWTGVNKGKKRHWMVTIYSASQLKVKIQIQKDINNAKVYELIWVNKILI